MACFQGTLTFLAHFQYYFIVVYLLCISKIIVKERYNVAYTGNRFK